VIIKKSPQEIDKMARAGDVLAATLDEIERAIRPGVSTGELDKLAERFIRAHGATPTFKGYRGFPGSICASPNAMIVHGIPGAYRLASGDIISIDVGVTLDGWVADAARTFTVEDVDERVQSLLETTDASLHAGVEQCRHGNRVGDISNAIQLVVEDAGFSVVRSLVGHGVGRSMHEDPQVPNHGKPGKGPLLQEGMVLAIEPMTTAGRAAVRVAGDGWAIFSQDGSAAAHFEFTVAVTSDGPRILTPWYLPADARSAAAAPARGPAGAGQADGDAELVERIASAG
jgi:methionyl aminopeptidase